MSATSASRREFLVLAAVGGVGLTLGFRLDGGEAEAAAGGELRPNAWISVRPDGRVRLTIGKTEMGQGVRTAIAMILADELGAAWESIDLEQAEPGPEVGDLGTGGSWSIAWAWMRLRKPAAAAREMLVAAAAERWGVAPAACEARDGRVRERGTQRSLGFGELASAAAARRPPADPPLRARGERALVGTSRRRVDGPAIVEGKAVYGLDARVPGQLFAVVARPPVLGGKLKSFDAGSAKAVPGVVEAVAIPAGVAVVGTNTWAAIRGRAALAASWDDGPLAGFSSAGYEKQLAAAVERPGVATRKEGDGLAALPRAARRFAAVYHYPFYAHMPVEPMNALAIAAPDRCEIWVPTQDPNDLRDAVVRQFGYAIDDVRVHVTLVGGGFGRRLAWDYGLEAVATSRALGGRPVQVVWTRDDDTRHGHFQSASVDRMVAAVDVGGKPLVWGHRKATSPHTARDRSPRAAELGSADFARDISWGVHDVPYVFPHLETEYIARLLPILIGPWRSVFAPSSIFAREGFFDEVAAALGRDPLALRLEWLAGPPVLESGSVRMERARLRRVLETVRERSGWGTPLPRGRGRGVACEAYDGTTHVAYVAEVTVGEGGALRVDRVVCAIDPGLAVHPNGVAQQVESAVVWSLSCVLGGEITIERGRVEQSSYADCPVLRLDQTPAIEVHLVDSGGEVPYGMGEPPVPALVPAVINAVHAATGRRLRRIPLAAADLA
jgi:isoquinoline 1-oxidoreductase beta subunit